MYSTFVSFNRKILSKEKKKKLTPLEFHSLSSLEKRLSLKRFRESLLAWEGAFPRNRKVARRIRPFGGRVPFSRKDLSCFRRNEEGKKRERVVKEEEEEEEGVVYRREKVVVLVHGSSTRARVHACND